MMIFANLGTLFRTFFKIDPFELFAAPKPTGKSMRLSRQR
jgi:hypothetical protein